MLPGGSCVKANAVVADVVEPADSLPSSSDLGVEH
jgi:hypothetical protein